MQNSSAALAGAAHQTVAAPIQLHTGSKSIQIDFTNQRLSPYAGSATFWGWRLAGNWRATLQAALPHPAPLSNNHRLPLDKALAFVHGVLADARQLTPVAYLRRDPLVPELLGIRRVASQSSRSRFFQGFDSAAVNRRSFRSLWQWGLNRLPSRPEGDPLDLDSTRLRHEDGGPEGVAVGYTKRGLKPCLHPRLAVVAEVRLVAQLWLRAGHASCGNNAVAFFLDLWAQRPRPIRRRGVRADAGFCLPDWLALWERLRLPYVVVAQLSQPIQRLLRGDLVWPATEVPGPEVTERESQALGWPHARRLVLVRHRVHERDQRGGKKLLDVPGYRFQALVTSLPPTQMAGLAVWRDDNARADCENVIKELPQGFALPSLCLRSFWATEAALSLAAVTDNLTVLFQRHLGWQQKVTIQTLRYWLFVTAGVLSHPAGRTTIKLAVPPHERAWWRRLWEKILSPIPNCHAVENRPSFSS